MMGIGIHHLLETGNCSTTGYTRYGPAPHCSSSSVDWGIVLPIATFLAIAGGAVGAPNIFVLLGPLFLGIGIGALTVADSPSGQAFILVFGGSFALVGAGLLAVPLWSALRRRGAGGVPASRIAIGLAACVGALALAFGVASLFPTEHPVGTPAAAAPPRPRLPTGATFPEISATDPESMYKTPKFKLALDVARYYLGADGKIRSAPVSCPAASTSASISAISAARTSASTPPAAT